MWYHVWSTNCQPFRSTCVVPRMKHELSTFPKSMRGTRCEARTGYLSRAHAWYHVWSTTCLPFRRTCVVPHVKYELCVYLSGARAWYHMRRTNCLPFRRTCVISRVKHELPTSLENMRCATCGGRTAYISGEHAQTTSFEWVCVCSNWYLFALSLFCLFFCHVFSFFITLIISLGIICCSFKSL